MSTINLFGLGNQSKSPSLTAANRLNLYYDIQTDNDKTQIAALCTPGLDLFCTPSPNKTYGLHWMETVNKLFVVQKSTLYEVSPDGTSTAIATISQDLNNRVSMANNGTELCIVSGKFAFIFNTSTRTISNITGLIAYDGQVADTVTFLDGRFIINRPNTGQFYISGLYDGLSWDALDFATAESHPDNIQAVIADKGNLYLLGTSSVEVWGNNGDVLFPFQKINAAPAEVGLAARWSLSKIAGSVVGLWRSTSGMLAIGILDGYMVNAISNQDIEYLINNYDTPQDAVGFGYVLNGKHFYQITFQKAAQSWLYDFQSKAWSQLKSHEITRHRVDIGCFFNNKFVVSDYESGNLYILNANTLTDNGDPIERELVSQHVYTKSRNNMVISRLRLDVEGGAGVLEGQGENPSIMLQISRDGGHTWGNELWTTFGGQGQYTKRAEWRRLGMARDWVFKIRITDPVRVVMIAAIIEHEELNK